MLNDLESHFYTTCTQRPVYSNMNCILLGITKFEFLFAEGPASAHLTGVTMSFCYIRKLNNYTL